MAITQTSTVHVRDDLQEKYPLLDVILDSHIGGGLLVNLHFSESLLHVLVVVVHIVGLAGGPALLQPAGVGLLSLVDVFPKTFHSVELLGDRLNTDLAVVDELRLAEFLCIETQVFNLRLEITNFLINTLDKLHALLSSSLVLIEISLLELSAEVFELILETFDLDVILGSLRLNVLLDFLLHVLCQFLEVSPIICELFVLFNLFIFGKAVSLQHLKAFVNLVES